MGEKSFFGGLLVENSNPLQELTAMGADVQSMVEMSGIMAPIPMLGGYGYTGAINTGDHGMGINSLQGSGRNRHEVESEANESYGGFDDFDEFGEFGDVDATEMDMLGDDEDDQALAFRGFDPDDLDESDDDYAGGDESDPVEDLLSDDTFLDMIDNEASDEDLESYIADAFGLDLEDASDVLSQVFDEIYGDEDDTDMGSDDDYSGFEGQSFESEDLISRIDDVLSEDEDDDTDDGDELDESEDWAHNSRLVGDIAELMAHRYNDMGQEDIANGLIAAADRADQLSQKRSMDESDHEVFAKLYDAVTESIKQYEETVGF